MSFFTIYFSLLGSYPQWCPPLALLKKNPICILRGLYFSGSAGHFKTNIPKPCFKKKKKSHLSPINNHLFTHSKSIYWVSVGPSRGRASWAVVSRPSTGTQLAQSARGESRGVWGHLPRPPRRRHWSCALRCQGLPCFSYFIYRANFSWEVRGL